MLNGTELYWVKVSALSQAAAAAATFLAVAVSLYIALHGRRPRLRLRIGDRMILGGGLPELMVLMFSVANLGQRPVHVRGIGWRTGWLRWGPSFLKRQHAVQLTGGTAFDDRNPPYELQPGEEASSYALLSNLLEYASERKADPFFTRDWPLLGRRTTTVWGYVFTADGYTFHARVEPSFLKRISDAEKAAAVKQE